MDFGPIRQVGKDKCSEVSDILRKGLTDRENKLTKKAPLCIFRKKEGMKPSDFEEKATFIYFSPVKKARTMPCHGLFGLFFGPLPAGAKSNPENLRMIESGANTL